MMADFMVDGKKFFFGSISKYSKAKLHRGVNFIRK